MRVQLKREGDMAWKLTVMEATHNHGRSVAPTAHPAYRIASLDPAIHVAVTKYHHIGMNSRQILMALYNEFPSILLLLKDVVNIV